jgi:nitrogen fixation NifU-like protein
MDLNAKNIIDHYRCPRHRGKMEGAHTCCHQLNRSCGDDITVYLKTVEGKLSDISFEGQGCSISTAATSILTDALLGRWTEEVLAMDFEDVKKILGIEISPRRYKCAMIGLAAIQEAIRKL